MIVSSSGELVALRFLASHSTFLPAPHRQVPQQHDLGERDRRTSGKFDVAGFSPRIARANSWKCPGERSNSTFGFSIPPISENFSP